MIIFRIFAGFSGFGKEQKAAKAEIICENRCVLQHISDYISDFSGFSGFGKEQKAEKTEIICENRCVLQHISDSISDLFGFFGFWAAES